MTLRETITQEFLDSVGDPGRIEGIFERFGRSKGPLYLGLAEATSRLRGQLEEIGSGLVANEKKLNELVRDVGLLDGRKQELSTQIEEINERNTKAVDELAETDGLLDMAGQLERMGFGIEQLARLSDSVEAIRAGSRSHDETLGQFFGFVERYECFTSLEAVLQGLHDRASDAKAQTEQLETALESTQFRSKARTEAIELAERLLQHGVGHEELALWENMVSGSKVVRERVTHELQEFGSLDKACGKLEADAARLRTATKASETRLSRLKFLETEVKHSVATTRDSAVRRIDSVGQAALGNLEEMMKVVRDYDDLKRRSEALGEDMKVARAFRSVDAREWEQIPGWAIHRILMGLILWSKSANGDRVVSPPEPVRQRANSLSHWTKVSTTDLLFWVLSGTFTEQERKAILNQSVG